MIDTIKNITLSILILYASIQSQENIKIKNNYFELQKFLNKNIYENSLFDRNKISFYKNIYEKDSTKFKLPPEIKSIKHYVDMFKPEYTKKGYKFKSNLFDIYGGKYSIEMNKTW